MCIYIYIKHFRENLFKKFILSWDFIKLLKSSYIPKLFFKFFHSNLNSEYRKNARKTFYLLKISTRVFISKNHPLNFLPTYLSTSIYTQVYLALVIINGTWKEDISRRERRRVVLFFIFSPSSPFSFFFYLSNRSPRFQRPGQRTTIRTRTVNLREGEREGSRESSLKSNSRAVSARWTIEQGSQRVP